MTQLSRRGFGGLLAGAAASFAMPNIAFGAVPKVVVIGGGAGGATAARYLAKGYKPGSAESLAVTLVEPAKRYYTCFFSNLYLGGFRDYASIGHGYDRLASSYGVNVVHDWASTVDRTNKTVTLGSNARLNYDHLVLSPGIDLKYDSIAGYSPEAQGRMPHAWKSGTQAQILKDQVLTMPEGGTFVMVAPPNPYRCPPGPYERISMVAHLLSQNNPTGKIIVIDPKEKFSKQGLFMAGWEQHYPGMIEWLGPDMHGGIERVDAHTMEIVTGLDTFKADAACVIPAQRAGQIALAAGINDSDWCPINPANMRSTMDQNITVLGDASVASAMPKSGFSANSQAKVAANAIRGELVGSKVFPARYANTCWSLIAPNDGVKVGASYKDGAEKIEVVDKFISQTGESAALREQTYRESLDWYSGMTADMFS